MASYNGRIYIPVKFELLACHLQIFYTLGGTLFAVIYRNANYQTDRKEIAVFPGKP